jgi:hypothetical protein
MNDPGTPGPACSRSVLTLICAAEESSRIRRNLEISYQTAERAAVRLSHQDVFVSMDHETQEVSILLLDGV